MLHKMTSPIFRHINSSSMNMNELLSVLCECHLRGPENCCVARLTQITLIAPARLTGQ